MIASSDLPRPLVVASLLGVLGGVLGLQSCSTTLPPVSTHEPPPSTDTPSDTVTEPPLSLEPLTWTESTPSPVALYEAQGLALAGELYVFGGYYNRQIQATTNTYALNPASTTWRSLSPLPEPVTHAGQAAYGDDIYLAGGFIGDHPGPATNHVWVYATDRDAWFAGPSLPEARGGGALVQLDGKLHYFGGTVRNGFDYLFDTGDHWVLNLASGGKTWAEAAPMPEPRNHMAGVALGGTLYAVGGQRLDEEDAGNSPYVHVYDPVTDGWQRVADLPKPIGHISAVTFAYGERIFIVGGVSQQRAKLRDVIAYDPRADRWSEFKGLPGGRSAAVAGELDGKLYLATGYSGGPLATTWVGTFGHSEPE